MGKAFPKDGRGRPAKYPWRKLKVGGEMFVESNGHKTLESLRCSLISGAHQSGAMRLETRVLPDRNGVLVRRIK